MILPAALFLFFILFGCVSIPEVPYVVSGRGDEALVRGETTCREENLSSFSGPGSLYPRGIEPEGFTLLSWNVMKGGREGWREDFALQAGDADLLTLQEANLTEELSTALRKGRFRWDLTAAFLKRKKETGVLTGSKASPVFSCVTRFTEPLFAIPKTTLASLYPVAGTDLFLLLVNVHLVNFTGAGGEYRRQLDALERLLKVHEGPLIAAGDFNTWSGGKVDAVASMAERAGLKKVLFTQGSPAAFFGRHVDHVFYRGLEQMDARAIEVSTSDHNPLRVKFRLSQR